MVPKCAPIAVPHFLGYFRPGSVLFVCLRSRRLFRPSLAGDRGRTRRPTSTDRVAKVHGPFRVWPRSRARMVRTGRVLVLMIAPCPKVRGRPGRAHAGRPSLAGNRHVTSSSALCAGGMGEIFEGRDLHLGRDLAVKVIREEHRHEPEIVRRFVEEAQIGGQLQHPGITPIHDVGRFPDGRLFIAMKLVRGRTLAALLDARERRDEDRMQFLSIFEQVCQAMAYAHSRGVIHRDLKPSNIMVGAFGEVQVMDWGLAKTLNQGALADVPAAIRSHDGAHSVRTLHRGGGGAESRVGSVLGTPSYMAPEQARGELDTLDKRADVFAPGRDPLRDPHRSGCVRRRFHDRGLPEGGASRPIGRVCASRRVCCRRRAGGARALVPSRRAQGPAA